MTLNKVSIEKKLMIFFITISLFSGIMGYLSYIMDNPIIKLWKEIYVLFFSLCIIFFNIDKIVRTNINYKFLLTIFISIFFFLEIVYSSLILEIPLIVILYQLKSDLLLFVFFVIVYIFFFSLSKEQLKIFSKSIIKIVIFLGLFNAIAMILQTIFFEQFLNLIGLDFGNWGTKVGLRIETVGEDILRPVGFQTGFIAASTVSLLSFFIMNENTIYRIRSKFIKLILNIIFIVSIFLSTYATAIIGLVTYFIIKGIYFIKLNKLYKKYVIYLFCVLLFGLFFYATHGLDIYEFVAEYYPDKAYSSILIRVLLYSDVINEWSNNILSLLLGVGLGTNGTYGMEKDLYGILSIPLDSTYIYMLSNYGIIGVIFYVFIMIYFILYFYNNDMLGINYFCIYILIIEFFFNNFMVDFPLNFIIMILIPLNFRIANINFERK